MPSHYESCYQCDGCLGDGKCSSPRLVEDKAQRPVTLIANAYTTMLAHRDSFPFNIEQQTVLCNLRDALVCLTGFKDQDVQDDAEQIALDNRICKGTEQIKVGCHEALNKQANEARVRLGLVQRSRFGQPCA